MRADGAHTNCHTRSLAGYKKGELEGKNVSILMPPPYNSRHNGYLKAYQMTGAADQCFGPTTALLKLDCWGICASAVAVWIAQCLFSHITHPFAGHRQGPHPGSDG